MSEVRRRRKKREGLEGKGENAEPNKEETAVAKHLRWNCPTKSSTMMGNKVEYFMGSKAVDCLLDSNWASGKGKTEILFTTRESCELYLDRLLHLGLFSRVYRIKKRKGEKEKSKEKQEEGEGKKKKEKEKKDKEKEKQEDGKKEQADDATEEKKKDSEAKSEDGKKKRKVKIKLEIHEEQLFLDGDDEAFVWIYDPVHPRTFVMGILVVIATIAICMFPLWPSNVREYVWYLSVIAAAGIGMILVLAVLRYVIFGILWALTGGRHKFWLLPNLTEECGFLESFVPIYTYEYSGNKESNKEKPENDGDRDDNKGKEEDDKGKEENEEGKQEKGMEVERGEETGNVTKGESSEEKDIEGNRESWVKVTEEDVENAKSEIMKGEELIRLQDEAATETTEDNQAEKVDDSHEDEDAES